PRFEEGARRRGAKQVCFLPVAAPDHISAQFQEKFAAPINYVGSIHINPKARAGIPLELRSYLQKVIDVKVESPELDFEEILTQLPLAPGKRITMSGPLHYFLYAEANRQSRVQFLRGLAPLGLRIYGNDVWKEELRALNLQNCFGGPLDPFDEYPGVICSSAVTLNLRSLQGFHAPTHRDFLTPRLGGFLLSSRIHEEPYDWKIVDPKNLYHLQDFPWSPSCRRPDEMAETASRYWRNLQERKDWIEHASQEIHLHHLYSQRMIQFGKMLDSAGVKS
ncbi:MAG: glycosyltransferase family protein, partial [Candidatus Hinthialibacter sp.]